ncbi:MAG TPA: GHKL domain-containing protein [Firmicutes bacterium]|nr:GHKL domain-containing protein [Bacillota bacterium]
MNLNNITKLIAIIIECGIMMYYCHSVLPYKKSKTTSSCIAVLGYIVYYFICILKLPTLNIIGFVVINFLIILLGYKDTIGDVIFKVTIITGLMMFSELIASLLIKTEINNEFATAITVAKDIIFTFASKLLYITAMIIFRHLSVNRNQRYQTREMIYLVVLPISTCLFLYLFNQISNILSNELEILFVIFSILLVAANFVAYFVCEKIIDKNLQNEKLKQIEYKKEINEKSYRLIQEKYNELKILVHDFDKYCNYIDSKIADGQEDVQALTKKIKDKSKEFLIVEYTNNRALNILLSQKVKECNEKQIDFQIYSQSVDVSFIEESDVIAIFGNLIDNAIESCMVSEAKKIFLQIKTLNDKFLVINLENSSNQEPIVENGKLKTRKADRDTHGIGLLSVKHALDNLQDHNGRLQWEYNADKRIFIATILISLQKKTSK